MTLCARCNREFDPGKTQGRETAIINKTVERTAQVANNGSKAVRAGAAATMAGRNGFKAGSKAALKSLSRGNNLTSMGSRATNATAQVSRGAQRVGYYVEKAGPAITVACGTVRAVGGILKDEPREVSKGVTGIGTSLAGGWAGGEAGAALGTLIFPGVGTAIGGFAGAVIGGLAASMAGDKVVDELHDAYGNDLCPDCR